MWRCQQLGCLSASVTDGYQIGTYLPHKGHRTMVLVGEEEQCWIWTLELLWESPWPAKTEHISLSAVFHSSQAYSQFRDNSTPGNWSAQRPGKQEQCWKNIEDSSLNSVAWKRFRTLQVGLEMQNVGAFFCYFSRMTQANWFCFRTGVTVNVISVLQLGVHSQEQRTQAYASQK